MQILLIRHNIKMELSDRSPGLVSLSVEDSEVVNISRREDGMSDDSPGTSCESEGDTASTSNPNSNVTRVTNGLITSKQEVLNVVHHLSLTKNSTKVQTEQDTVCIDEYRVYLNDCNSYANGSINSDKNVNLNDSSNSNSINEVGTASASCSLPSRNCNEIQINGNSESKICANDTVNMSCLNTSENEASAQCSEFNSSGLSSWRESSRSTNEILSPEMDFLEFDFEEQNLTGDEAHSESSDESRPISPQLETDSFSPSAKNNLGTSSGIVGNNFVHSLSYQNLVSSPKYHNNCLRPSAFSSFELCTSTETCSSLNDSDNANVEACGKRLLRRESSLFNIPNDAMDSEEYNLQSALLGSFNSKSVKDKQTTFSPAKVKSTEQDNSNGNTIIEKTMIWSEMEACTRQVTQIGRSACGATAVINVLMALNIPHDKATVKDHIHTRFRAETSPIAQYLISRSTAGTTHEDLISGIEEITNGAVYGRFFHMYPARDISLVHWLSSWIAKGAIPIATLNLQCGLSPGQSIPDAWHHQMVFGVGPKGVYLTNPLECVSASQIEQQTCSESVLLVRRNDVIGRWDVDCDLSSLIVRGPLWRELNVIGQVVNVLREAMCPWVPGRRRYLTSHIKIPAVYKSGVTLFVCRESDIFEELVSCPELSLSRGND